MFRHVTLLRQQRIALGLTSAALARGSFQPFSQNDENDLVKVVTTKPRHVLKYVRQQVWRSRKRELQFRNTVTHLMIIVQEMLRKQLMEPACATEIMDGILEECVKYSQHDMAHLLFRAALRFRKYNCTISVDSIRYLFESYKTNQSTELMLQLATEMKSDPSLRPLCVAAYLFANHEKEAMELQAGLSYRDYTKNDFLALIVGYEKLGKPEAIVSILEGLKDRALGSNDETAVVEAMLRVFYRSQNDALFNQVLQYAVERQLTLNHTVCTTVLRHRTRQANSTAEVHAIEEEMKEMGYVPDATGNSVIISAFARLIHYGDRGSEELMLTKVDTLLASVEKRLEQGDPDLDVSVAHVRAIIRGYGAAGRPESLKDAWGRLRKSPITQDIRIYNELFRWLATMGNVKDVLTLKEELDKGTINPDALTYTWMLRALGRYYPRHVDQLCCEIEKHHIRPDVQLYNTMLGIFGDLGWFDKVEVTRADMKRRVDAGTLQLTPFTFAVLLRIYSKDGEKVHLIMNEAKERNVASHPHVQTSYLSAVMAQDSSDAVFDAYLKEIPVWGTDIYNVLLHKYGREKNLELFESTLAKMRKEEITMNDVTFGTLITAYARFGEREKVNGIIEIIKSDEGSVSPVFYSVLASSLNRLGNSDGVNTAWEDLVSSKLFPDTDVYNHFLGLYSRQHNVPKMQDVLDNMMRLVPPNPITATTVLDVLGKSGRVSEMEALFEDMKTSADTYPTSVTYHQMLNAYAKSGDTSKMEFLYQEMIEKGHRATAVTYNILLDGYGRVKNIERVEELLRERQSNGIPSDDISRSIQFSAYGRARRSDEVQKLLVDITEGETSNATLSKKVVWSAIDAGCRCRNAELMERAVELLKRFSEDGALSASDESSLIPYYCRLGQMEKVETLMEHAKQRGDALSYRALNAIARGYATMGRLDKTVEVLHQLRDSKWVPDASTALQLSGAFLQAGLHEQAKQIIDWRRQYANAVGSHSTSRST